MKYRYLFDFFLILMLSFIEGCRPSADVILEETDYRLMVTVAANQIMTTQGGTSSFPKGTTLDSYEMAAYMVTYQLYYTIYDWAINNGYEFQNVASAGTHGGGGVLPEAFDDNRYQPVCDLNVWDWITFCNAYSRYAGYTPVYYADAAYSNEIVSSADEKVASYGSRPYIKSDTNGNQSVKKCTVNGYRLPSYTEWEYAARGGDCSAADWKYSFSGSNDPNEVAVHSASKTEVVASKKPNRLGLYDMSGNLWELVDAFDTKNCWGCRGGSFGSGAAGKSHACAIGYNNGLTFEGNSCPPGWFTVRMTRSIR